MFFQQGYKTGVPREKKFQALSGNRPIPIKMDDTLLARIEALAVRIGEPKSTVMRMCMRVGLDQMEKAYDNMNSTTYLPGQTSGMEVSEKAKSKKNAA